ncbi:MAG: hypothetical protein PHD51_01070 [Patescibacteria group bacterium]|nr:hypothetical protein [Patescibacteria group bacterium]MDD5490546.1 hypothetical protein [Patescibacteria group bacterium]
MLYVCGFLIILGVGLILYQQFQLPKMLQRERVRTRQVCVRLLYRSNTLIPYALQGYNATAEENEEILEES